MQIIRKGVCAQEGDQTFVETVDRLWIFGMQEKKTVSAYAAKKFATSVALEMDPQKLLGRGSAAVTNVCACEQHQTYWHISCTKNLGVIKIFMTICFLGKH